MNVRECLIPHALGCGLKEWEIIANAPGVCAALIGLISHLPGNEPADLANSPMVGRWAGHRILAVGDYAEDGDIPDFDGPPLSRLYELCGTSTEVGPKPTIKSLSDNYADTSINGFAPGSAGWKKWVRTQLPAAVKGWAREKADIEAGNIFLDQAKACQGMVEQGASVRFCGSGRLVQVPVRTLATAHADGIARYEIRETDPQALGFYQRCGVTEADWHRPPRDLSWHGIRDHEVDQGQRRLLVNLDCREFIDPIQFGEVPTTAGLMRGEWVSAAALAMTLFHSERRGGGDIPLKHPGFKGRWRNQRLVATGGRESDGIPSTEEVLNGAGWSDISSDAMRAVADAKTW